PPPPPPPPPPYFFKSTAHPPQLPRCFLGGRDRCLNDTALGLPAKRWLDIDVDGDFGSENMLAEKPDPAGKGASSGKSVASPR
ncbi:hypothetical protein QYG31_11745, partial [Xanthomonas perforans]